MAKVVHKKKDWAFIKNRTTQKGLEIDYDVKNYGYQVFAKEHNTMWFTNLYDPTFGSVVGKSNTNDTDFADFENNFKPEIDGTPPQHLDGVDLPYLSDTSGRKLAIHESSRPLFEGKKYGTYYVGVDDNFQTGEYLGDPDVAFITVGATEPSISKDFEFDPQHGDVWIHEGYAWWSGAGDGDYFSVKIIANPTPLATSNVPLDYELDGNKIHYAAGGAGTGTHGFAGTPVPVFKPSSDGYWNLVDGSLQPASSQDGEYDLYTVEVFVDYIIAKIPVLGTATNYVKFQSADTSQLPAGYKLRVELTNASANTWSIGFFMTVYRELPEPIPLS